MKTKNQCAGCLAGRPLDENGNHRMGDGIYTDLMWCERSKGPMTDHQKLIAARSVIKALRAENKALRATAAVSNQTLEIIHETIMDRTNVCTANEPGVFHDFPSNWDVDYDQHENY